MKSLKTILTLSTLASVAVANAIGLGDIAFIGFNADGTDGYSFVALNAISSSDVIGFTDEEWNGSGWITNTESQWTWTAPVAGVAAGTVVTITNMSALISGDPVENLGTIANVSDAVNNAGFGNSDESIYAYSGTHAAPSLIAAMTTETGANFGTLSGGSLVTLAADTDGAKYTGPRSGLGSFSAYLPGIADVANNWTDEGTSGTDNFNNTAFTIVPEPTSILALGFGAVALLRRKK
ncbi:MAG: PEP-CTERM sorting domain-containing protein [Armatimonadetes bacterium]|nr:PEP-CTERM sorting domain-containing protein [Armatimonadota bacterium]